MNGTETSAPTAVRPRPETLLTVGQIATKLGQPLHRIEYLLRTRDVRPVGRAGNAWVYLPTELEYLAGQLRRMDEARQR